MSRRTRVLVGIAVGAAMGTLLWALVLVPLSSDGSPVSSQVQAFMDWLHISGTSFPWWLMLAFAAAGAAWGTGRRKAPASPL